MRTLCQDTRRRRSFYCFAQIKKIKKKNKKKKKKKKKKKIKQKKKQFLK